MTRTNIDIGALDRRRFLRGSAVALALPWMESAAHAASPLGPGEDDENGPRKRFATIYFPDGVPMPLAEDPAHKEWSWFPHGSGKTFEFTKCLEPHRLAPRRTHDRVRHVASHGA